MKGTHAVDLEMSPTFNFRLSGKELSIVIRALRDRIKAKGLNELSPESQLLITIFEKRLNLALAYVKQLEVVAAGAGTEETAP